MSGRPVSPDVVWHEGGVPRADRWGAAGAHGATVWLTGLPGSGKSTIASALTTALTSRGVLSYSLDGRALKGAAVFSSPAMPGDAKDARRSG